MRCDRCRHPLYREWIIAGFSWWWVCRGCGERIDAVILRHRAEQAMQAAWERQESQARLAVEALFSR